ncbi:hypothetical protein ACFSTC_08730 [Nonomuraea ferruginea]
MAAGRRGGGRRGPAGRRHPDLRRSALGAGRRAHELRRRRDRLVRARRARARARPAPRRWTTGRAGGITHTQYSADNEDRVAREAARGILGRVPMLQNQHIMGWGAGNPEPSPGQYNFVDLNRRLKFMASSRSIPVITLCCAPDWMKGGQAGRTDWSKNHTVAVKPEHFERLRQARRPGRQAVSDGRVLHGVERVQGLLERQHQPVGRRGLHRALQQGLRRAQEGQPEDQGRRPLRADRELQGRQAVRAEGHVRQRRPAGAGRDRVLDRAQEGRRLHRRRRRHHDHRRRQRPRRLRGHREVQRDQHLAQAEERRPAGLVGRVVRRARRLRLDRGQADRRPGHGPHGVRQERRLHGSLLEPADQGPRRVRRLPVAVRHRRGDAHG